MLDGMTLCLMQNSSNEVGYQDIAVVKRHKLGLFGHVAGFQAHTGISDT